MNETFTAHITALTHDGRGIAQINGKTVFIEGALPNEEVAFTYTSKRGKFDEGRVSEILTASTDRTIPLCPHFTICGGCALQHMTPTAQITMKQNILLDQLQHFGGVTPKEILPPLMGPVWHYRGKARLSVKYVHKKQAVLAGFHEKKGRYVADLTRCEVLKAPVGELITPLKQLIQQLDCYQHIPQIEVAITDQATALVFRHMVDLSENDSQQLINFAKLHNLHIYLQPQGPQSIHLLWPDQTSDLLSYQLPDYQLELNFSPTNFTQINTEINQQMIATALRLLDLQKTDHVLDLFCGLGNFTLPLAKFCESVVGIEGDDDLVARAQQNAAKNQINNAQFFKADLSAVNCFANLAGQKFDKILLDPPRTGALAAVEQLAKFKAQKIVYISCNPATLARDTKILVEQGYRLTKAGVMDMFPHTHHVEAMALFVKRN